MFLLNENFVYRKIYDVNLLIPVKRNSISDDAICLNETAALVFQMCNGAGNVHELAMKMFEKFVDVDQNEVVPELESYIQNLISDGLLIER